MEKTKSILKKPLECRENELDNFVSLVILGDQVNEHGLKQRIKRAELLGFWYEKNVLVGTTGLKRPYRSYKEKVFKEADFSQTSNKYNLEIGWVFVKKEHRKKQIGANLVQEINEVCKDQNVFATTRINNTAMQKILKRNGFRKVGHQYEGTKEGEFVELFIRDK